MSRSDKSPTPFLAILTRCPLMGVLSLGVVFLLALLAIVDTEHVLATALRSSANDQVGYISVGRHLAEFGELRSSLIYPSILNQQTTTNTLYVPGYFYSLAFSFRLFGYSALSAFAPSLLSYLVASCALFLAARRLFDGATAWMATILFMTFPANLIYSSLAMAEMPLLAASMLCFAAFVFVPTKWKAYAGPLLLFIPVSFRETAAVLLIPMTAVLINESSAGRAKKAAVMVSLSLVVVILEVAVVFGGRPSLFMVNVFSGDFFQKYADAFYQEQLSPSVIDWIDAIVGKVESNVDSLLTLGSRTSFEAGSLWFLFALIPLGIILALWKRDLLVASFAAVGAVLAAALLALYSASGFTGIRFMLISHPFAAIIAARLLLGTVSHAHHRKLLITILFTGIIVGGLGVWNVKGDPEALHEREVSTVTFLETLHHDDTRLLVAPFWLSLPYVLQHFPVDWSFLPTDRRTLVRLSENYRIGTIVLPVSHRYDRLTPQDVLSVGFVHVARVAHDFTEFDIFREGEIPQRVHDSSQIESLTTGFRSSFFQPRLGGPNSSFRAASHRPESGEGETM